MREQELLAVLVYIQAHLDQPLTLRELASQAGFAPSHFHAEFRRLTRQSPRQYVQRVRLERAAYLLRLLGDSVLTIALDVGYRTHETFSRAFRRHFRVSPHKYRRTGEEWPASSVHGPQPPQGFTLSDTRARTVNPARIAFIRHTGPYELVPPELWTRVAAYLAERGYPHDGPRVGIGHDAPNITDASMLRFDAGIIVGEEVEGHGEVGVQVLEGGPAAATTHVGPYSSLPQAYPLVFQRASQLKGFELIGLPAVEVYHAKVLDPSLGLQYTDIYLPLRRA
jgi:AraC family transcriptional regulator